jgi:hypothetical protein
MAETVRPDLQVLRSVEIGWWKGVQMAVAMLEYE